MPFYREVVVNGIRYGVRSDVRPKDAKLAISKRLREGKCLPDWSVVLKNDEHPF